MHTTKDHAPVHQFDFAGEELRNALTTVGDLDVRVLALKLGAVLVVLVLVLLREAPLALLGSQKPGRKT